MSLNWQGGNQPFAGQPYGGQPFMRASDADRERAADVLKAGYAEGRLGKDEYDARLNRLHRALTYAEIQPVIADLPQGPVPAQPAVRHPEPMVHITPPRYIAPMPPPPAPPYSGVAIAALVLAILTPMTYGVCAIPSVILGHIAKADVRKTGKQGDGFATAGLVVGYLALGLIALVVLLGVTLAG
ncbi:DUF1707 and DUF4190 domain-containing protein [Streptomyces sp. JJ38]|uniref:DUF1707 and DUF4190 domain-containing protein n=1 Tax=Streptomyces sp. JJ38 TaxID=2738128 RepID=UPI0027D7BEEC|nr:DUF1707 and DUF4190 domain-containing protein [Streptomyces sp. JJ38]